MPVEHPLCRRCVEAAKKIKEETGGRLDITLFPNSILSQDSLPYAPFRPALPF